MLNEQDRYNLAWDCAVMLEKHYDAVKKLNGINELFLLPKDDLAIWQNTYYKALVETRFIIDGEFFKYPIKDDEDVGIWKDGRFNKYEYVQFLYRIYKKLLDAFGVFVFQCQNKTVLKLLPCIEFLEHYLKNFEGKGARDEHQEGVSPSEAAVWQGYYEALVKTAGIPDGSFFGDVTKNANYGIGKDGWFTGAELFHFLYQCCKNAFMLIGGELVNAQSAVASMFIEESEPVWGGTLAACRSVNNSTAGDIVKKTAQFLFDPGHIFS
jgi:hypothetical protein